MNLAGIACIQQAILEGSTSADNPGIFASIVSKLLMALYTFFLSLIALISCWLSLHIFLVVTCGLASLKKLPFEIAGFILVLTVLLIRVSTEVAFHIMCNPTKTPHCMVALTLVAVFTLIVIGASLFGLTFISIATVVLIMRSFYSTQLNGEMRKFYRQALKAALPFLLLQICGVLYILLIIVLLALPEDHKLLRYYKYLNLIPTLLYPCSFVLLPILLLCQPQVTHDLKCRRGMGRKRRGGGGNEDEDRLETAPTSHWSTAVSRTQFIAPPESVLTEQDPLIIEQGVQ